MRASHERGAGLRAAQHAIAAAHCAAASPTQGAALTWQDLLDWPAWAQGDAAADRDVLALRVAALWHAGALRRCIDGRVLQQAGRLLGEPVLEQVLATGDDAALRDQRGAGGLPTEDSLEAAWRGAGRSLLLAGLASPALRSALAVHLDGAHLNGGHADAAAPASIDTALAQRLIARAGALRTGDQT